MKRKGGFGPVWVNQVIINTLTPYWVLMYKTEECMQTALNTIEYIRDNIVPKLWANDVHELRLCHEVRNIVLHSEMKLKASMMRKESRWNHYRADYPLRDDKNWLCWIKIKDVDGVMTFTKEPVPEKWRPDPTLPYVERYPYALPNEPEVFPDDL
jgi:succinate dehydrogenase/fumarate reductase flavoprotein subunit